MDFEKVLELAREEFELIKDSGHCYVVRTGLTYDGCEGFCVALYKKENGEVVITDLGETKEVFCDVTEEEWQELCLYHGFEFNRWRIEKPFTSMEDLFSFIGFLDYVSDLFFNVEE